MIDPVTYMEPAKLLGVAITQHPRLHSAWVSK
jgi:hypothetical protein